MCRGHVGLGGPYPGAHATVEASQGTVAVAQALRGDAQRCRELGVAGYLAKPFVPDEVQELIQMVLAGSGSAETLVTRHALSEERARLNVLLADDVEVNRVNLNDQTVEGLRHRELFACVGGGLQAAALLPRLDHHHSVRERALQPVPRHERTYARPGARR